MSTSTILASDNEALHNTPLLRLPNELLIHCLEYSLDFHHIDYEDSWLKVRFVCRHINELCLPLFGKSYFGHLLVLFHPQSFRVLGEIASSQKLAKYVHRVTISSQTMGRASREGEEGEVQDCIPDNDVLVQAFKSLSNLQSIQLDGYSFFDPGEGRKGLRCGERLISDLQVDDHGIFTNTYRKMYSFALLALFNASMHEKVSIDLDFPSPEGLELPEVNLDSDYWVACAQGVRSLTFSCDTSTEWHQKLFLSTSKLEHLGLDVNSWTFNLDKLVALQHTWSILRFIELDQVSCSCTALKGLLLSNKESLAEIKLRNITITEGGTWAEPLALMCSMPKLTNLILSDLAANLPVPVTYFDREGAHFEAKDNERVTVGLKVITNDLRMMQCNNIEGAQGLVNFRRVIE